MDYVNYTDVNDLLSCGFTYGISQSIMWGKDKAGNEYQVIEDKDLLLFGKRTKHCVESHQPMVRETFERQFLGY